MVDFLSPQRVDDTNIEDDEHVDEFDEFGGRVREIIIAQRRHDIISLMISDAID